MKRIVRIILAYLLLAFFIIPLGHQWIIISWGYLQSVFLPGNFVFYFGILSLVGIIHPNTHLVTKKTSKLLFFFSLLVFTSGSVYEYFQVKNLPNELRDGGGWNRLIFGDKVEDKEGIDELCDYLQKGTIQVNLDDTIFLLISGAHSCSCGHGERLTINKKNKTYYIKHDKFQQLGFVSVNNSGWRDYCWRLDPNYNNHNKTSEGISRSSASRNPSS